MLTIKTEDKFTVQVTTKALSQNGTSAPQVTFKAQFKFIGQAEFDQLLEDVRAEEMGNSDVVETYLVGLSDINDSEGNEVPFESAKKYIMGHPVYCGATARCFIEHLSGAKQGNSKRRRGA